MSNDIPTGKTYLGFGLLWGVVVPNVVLPLGVALFAAGHVIIGIFTILLTGYGYLRHSSSITRRSQQIVRRPSPELRRILAIDRQRRALAGGSPSELDIIEATQNPHLQLAKISFFIGAAIFALAFLLSWACEDPVMFIYLGIMSLIFIYGIARLLWQAARWRARDEDG